MSRRTIVHLLRHGEVHNPEQVLYGRLPGYRLSAAGVAMAQAAAAFLAGRDITGLYSSPLDRARQTAEPFEGLTGQPAVIDPRLIEAANVFEGSRVAVGDGVLRSARSWRHLGNPFRPSWGEPYAEVAARMLAAIDDARREQDGHEALLISHQLPVVCARRALERRPLWHRPDRRQCALASLTSLVYDDGVLVRTEYAEPAARVPVTQQVTTGA